MDQSVIPWLLTFENVPDTVSTSNGEETVDAKSNAQLAKNSILADLLVPQVALTQRPNATTLSVLMVVTVHSTLTATTENALLENNAHVFTEIKFTKPESDSDEIAINVFALEVTSIVPKMSVTVYVLFKKVMFQLLTVKNTASMANALILCGKPLTNLSV